MPKDDHKDHEALNNLPPAVALSWGLVKESQRGPKREMSIKKIVNAAIAIAEKDGLSAVSMSRVAKSLGFTAMSIYRYIPSKNDLLLLMQEEVCEAIRIPPEHMDWRENMREYVRGCIQIFRSHPWYGDIPISGVPLTPNNLKFVDWVLRSMRDFPISDYEKMSIVLLVSSYARSCAIVQRDMERAMQAGMSPGAFSGLDYSAALKQLVTPERFPHLYPVVKSGAYTEDVEGENMVDNDFDFGLERILDGIQHYLDTVEKRKGLVQE